MWVRRLLLLSFSLLTTSCGGSGTQEAALAASPPAYLLIQPAAPRRIGERNVVVLNYAADAGSRAESFRIQMDFETRSAAVYFQSNTTRTSTLFHLTWDETRYRLESWSGSAITVVVVDRITGETALGTVDAAWRPGVALAALCVPGWARL